ncbi:MAG: hypothetical protein IIY93_13765 [Clostridia bacterium]|nr:hypothetical protein [Clostridia bacterium]
MRNVRRTVFLVIIGLVIILVGVGYAARALGYNFDVSSLFFDGWWTVFIIVPGVLGFFDRDSNKIADVILIAVGVGLLVSSLMDVDLWKWIAPVAIVAVGVKIIGKAFMKGDKTEALPDGKEEKTDGKE